MKTLVTGGAGFIGSHVARHWRAAGHEVVILDDLNGGFAENIFPGCQLVRGSILDATLIERVNPVDAPGGSGVAN